MRDQLDVSIRSTDTRLPGSTFDVVWESPPNNAGFRAALVRMTWAPNALHRGERTIFRIGVFSPKRNAWGWVDMSPVLISELLSELVDLPELRTASVRAEWAGRYDK
jgi:hypothetical protein